MFFFFFWLTVTKALSLYWINTLVIIIYGTKQKKNSLKLSLEEREETLTPVHLCVILQSAWESVANAIKVEFTTLEMN